MSGPRKTSEVCPFCGSPKPSNIDYVEYAQNDLNSACTHEAGHFVLAETYGWAPFAFIADTGCRCLGRKPFFGLTVLESTPTPFPRFKQRVWGLAGVMAECLGQTQSIEELAEAGIKLFLSDIAQQAISNTDIENVGKCTLAELQKAGAEAAKILRQEQARIEPIAEALKLNGIYPGTATRYCHSGFEFLRILPEPARLPFAKSEFKPQGLIDPKATSAEAFAAFMERTNALNGKTDQGE